MSTQSQSGRRPYDPKTPGARALRDRIVHGAFVTEGTMIAFPTCFPAVTTPVPADESRITALDVTPDGIVYAGTSGFAAHLLVGMFHGVTGMVFDMGLVEGADRCVAMCCGKDVCAAAVNGPAGGRIVVRPLQPLPFDLIQEWHIARTPYEYLDPVVADEPIVHAVTDSTREFVVGVTEGHLFTVDLTSRCVETIAELPGKACLVCGPSGAVYGLDDNAALWRFDMANRKVERAAVALPDGVWESVRVVWARDPHTGVLYTADAQGRLFRFDEDEGFAGPLATVPHTPVHCMAATNDGRLFGFAGEGMARLFCCNPGMESMADCGVAVSVFERRRYGYSFADAVRGRDGELIFGENDDLGHLWLYFPRIEPADSHGHHR